MSSGRRWRDGPAGPFVRDVLVQALGTLLAAGVIGLAATLSGNLSYDPKFAGRLLSVAVTLAAEIWLLWATDGPRFTRWERAIAVTGGTAASFFLGVVLGVTLEVATRGLA